MISENIKTLMGEELAGQVEEALKGKGKDGKDVDLVAGNDGAFVPAEKYDGEKRRAAAAENALKSAADAVKALGGSGDPAKLGEDVVKAQGTMETLKTGHKKELDGIRKGTALRMALAGKVYDPEDVIGMLDLDKIELGEDGGLKTDLAELLKPIQEGKPHFFREEKPERPPLSGARPAPVGGEPPKQYTQEEIGKMSMAEYRVYREKSGGFPKN